MCHLFVACSLSCPDFEKKWQPRLLSCSTARDHSRRTLARDIYPCGNLTTLWNEDICPYCLTAQLGEGAAKYVREMLAKYPLRYTPVPGRDRYMRWSGRAREKFDIEWRMENRSSRKLGAGYGADVKCKSGYGKGGSGEEYFLEKGRRKSRLASKWWGETKEPVVMKEKEISYDCRPASQHKDTDHPCKPVREAWVINPEIAMRETEYLCKPQRQTTEIKYKCKPIGATGRYCTTTSPCGKIVYNGTKNERRKWEKEEDRTYERYAKEKRRSSQTTTYRRNGYDINIEVEEVKPRKKSVRFSDFDKYYYGHY